MRIGREVLLDGAQHDVAPLAVEVLDVLDVLVDEPVSGDLVGGHLLGHARVQVGRLLAVQQRFHAPRAATIQPRRKPGARIFENVPR